MTDNVKDIFTKKDLSEIEAKKQEEADEHQEALRFNLQQLIDQQQELLDSGEMSGLAYICTTRNGYAAPDLIYDRIGDIIKMNFLVDLLKEDIIVGCLDESATHTNQTED